MKRIIVVLAGMFLIGASLFGAGNQAVSAGVPKARQQPLTKLPFSDGKTTITIFGILNNLVTSYDYADNLFTKKVVDATGINLEFITTTGADARSKLNAMLSSGDYPDVINMGQMSLSVDTLNYYASQGIFIALDDYNLLKYPIIAKVFQENPAINDVYRVYDGKVYALPYVGECPHCDYRFGHATYHMPFIRDNNLRVPKTLDELTGYMRWVRDNDANRNGKKDDEIPMAFASGDLPQAIAMTAKAFMPFIYTPAYFGLALDDNRKVIEQYKDPLFREALKYLNLWYKEGLILENSFTMTADQMRSLVQNPDPLVAIIPAANGQGFTRIGTQRWIEQINLEPLKGPDGAQWAGQRDPWSNYFMGWIITDKCKDPELVIALYNWMLNDEVALDGYIGPKGQSWDDSIPGTKAINGSVPFFRLLVPFGSQAINCSWNNEEPIYSPKGRFNYGQQGTAYDMAVQWITSGYPAVMDKLLNDGSYNETKNYLHAVQDSKYSVPIKYFIPPLVISETDNARRSDINAVLDLYKTQAFVAFITGTKNINSNADWNTYLADLDRMGSKELAALLQKYIK